MDPVQCPRCHRTFSLSAEWVGKAFKCGCGSVVQAPAALSLVPLPPPVRQPVAAPFDFDDDAESDYVPAVTTRHYTAPRSAPKESAAVVHSLGIGSMVVGVVAFLVAVVPLLGAVSLPLAAIGLLLGIVATFLSIFRHGRGIGFGIAGMTLNGMAIAVITLWLTAIFGDRSPALPSPAIEVAKGDDKSLGGPAKKPAELIDASVKSARKGDVIITIDSVRVGKVILDDFLGVTESAESLLQIRLTIKNKSKTKRLEYRQMSPRFGWGEEAATLVDNFGNIHKHNHFGLGTKIRGQSRETYIDPESEHFDLLIFDPPIARFQSLTLEIPASAVGQSGRVRFFIPKSMVVGAGN